MYTSSNSNGRAHTWATVFFYLLSDILSRKRSVNIRMIHTSSGVDATYCSGVRKKTHNCPLVIAAAKDGEKNQIAVFLSKIHQKYLQHKLLDLNWTRRSHLEICREKTSDVENVVISNWNKIWSPSFFFIISRIQFTIFSTLKPTLIMLMICRLVDTVQWNKTTQHDTNEIFGHSIICCQLTLKFIWPQSGLQCPFWLRVAESSSPLWWRPACCRASPSSRPSWCSRLRPHPEGLIVNKLLQMFYNRETNYDVDDAHCFSVLTTWKANS